MLIRRIPNASIEATVVQIRLTLRNKYRRKYSRRPTSEKADRGILSAKPSGEVFHLKTRLDRSLSRVVSII
jgi:hypothetical protein